MDIHELLHHLPEEIITARKRIAPHILETPLIPSPWLSRAIDAEVWLKCEHLQYTGSFKLRGAANKLLALSKEERSKGVISASTGNHGLALATIGQKLSIPCTIYLPEKAAPAKIERLRRTGAELVIAGSQSGETERFARAEAKKLGRTFVSPYNDLQVIAGQGTAAMEICEQLSDFDDLLVPVGGGGLASGLAGWVHHKNPKTRIWGLQPQNSPAMYAAFAAGRIVEVKHHSTLSDGTAGGLEPGSITFPICKELLNDLWLIEEKAISQAIFDLIDHESLLVEGAAAMTVAGLTQKAAKFKGRRVVLFLCGRRISTDALAEILNRHAGDNQPEGQGGQ